MNSELYQRSRSNKTVLDVMLLLQSRAISELASRSFAEMFAVAKVMQTSYTTAQLVGFIKLQPLTSIVVLFLACARIPVTLPGANFSKVQNITSRIL